MCHFLTYLLISKEKPLFFLRFFTSDNRLFYLVLLINKRGGNVLDYGYYNLFLLCVFMQFDFIETRFLEGETLLLDKMKTGQN